MPKSDDYRNIWGIHTKDDTLFLKGNVIAIGWKKMGDLSLIAPNREAFKEKYELTFPDAKKGSIATGAGMLYRFCCEVQVGDYVVYPSKSNRQINLGVIESGYIYDTSHYEYVQLHKVKWLKHLPRTLFSQGALYEVGSALSFFAIKNYADEFIAALDAKTLPMEIEDETVSSTADEIIERGGTPQFVVNLLYQNKEMFIDLANRVYGKMSEEDKHYYNSQLFLYHVKF